MQKKIAIVSYQFREDNLRLQPWRYVYEMAKRLPRHGWSTTIVTNACFRGYDDLIDITVKDCFPLSPFSRNSILRAMEDILADIILWPLGAKSIAYAPVLRKLKAKIIGYLPGPILNLSDLYAACLSKLPNESLLAVSWILARMVQWGKIMASCCESFVVLSEANRQAIIDMGVDESRVHLITAGRDSFIEMPDKASFKNSGDSPKSYARGRKVALFMGWPNRVRGIELLLHAFRIAAKQNGNLYLKILARGESTEDHRRLHRSVRQHSAGKRIIVVVGFLERDDILKHISDCNFGVLPFIQIPADRPLSFLDFFSMGKPVVSTDASCIPELIGDTRGKVSRRINPNDLATAMLKMASMSDDNSEQYREACLRFIRHYPDWDQCASKLLEVLQIAR